MPFLAWLFAKTSDDKNGDIVAVEIIAFSKRVSKEGLVEAIAV